MKRFLWPVVILIIAAGIADVAVSYWPAATLPRVQALIPNPGGTYTPQCPGMSLASAWTRHNIHNAILGTDGVKTFDFDSDGDQDVVGPWEGAARATFSENPGAGAVRGASSWTTAQIDTLTAMEGLGLGDFDMDGLQDTCTTQQSPGAVHIVFGPASGWTTGGNWTSMNLTVLSGSNIGWMECTAMDVDSDGHTDIVIGGDTQGAGGQLSWVKGPAASKRTAANWTPRTDIEGSGRIMTLQVRNIDGDGDQDILASTRVAPNVGIFWQEKTGAGTFTRHNISANIAFNGGDVFMLFDPGDLDGDGDDDICGVNDASVLRCMYNMDSSGAGGGDWLTWTPQALPQPASFGPYMSAAIGDINLDTYPDVVVASHAGAANTQSALVWLKGPTWTRGEIEGIDAFLSKYDNVKLLDLDGDGDLDVLAGDQGDEDVNQEGNEGLAWFENPCKS